MGIKTGTIDGYPGFIRRYRPIGIVISFALAFGACSAQNLTAIESGLQTAQTVVPDTVKTTCAVLSYADLGFKIAVPIAKISQANQITEAQWMKTVNDICAVAPADSAAALATLAQALAAINAGTNTGAVPPAPAAVPVAAITPAS